MDIYNDKYFNWQKHIGKIGGKLNKFKFEKFITDSNICLLDYGCGGGYLLNSLNAARKIGYDINNCALEECKKFNIETYNNLADIPDNIVDIIISNHVFEHVPNPYEILKILKTKLKHNGLIIIVVPCEQPSETNFYYNEHDHNKHLFTWSPMSLGNLLDYSGYKVIESTVIRHQWCSDYETAYNDDDFDKRCVENAIKNGNYQVRAVAMKKD